MNAPKALPARPVRSHRSFPTFRAISALVLREMSVTYGRSPGGYLWAVLEPALGIFLLTFIFSLAFRSPPLGANFPLFYATGLIPFLFYAELSSKLSQSLKFSRQLLAYPAVTFTDAIAARLVLNTITLLFVGYLIFAGILALFDTRTVLDPVALVLAYAMTIALALGIGVMNCVLVSMIPVWAQVWSIVNRPLFIISCIFFLYDSVPEPWRSILWWNPIIHLVGQMRTAFYPTYDAVYVSPVYVFGLSLFLLTAGLVFLTRYSRDIIHG